MSNQGFEETPLPALVPGEPVEYGAELRPLLPEVPFTPHRPDRPEKSEGGSGDSIVAEPAERATRDRRRLQEQDAGPGRGCHLA